MLDEENAYNYRGISVYPDAKNTVAWLKDNMSRWAEMSGKGEDWDGEWDEKYD